MADSCPNSFDTIEHKLLECFQESDLSSQSNHQSEDD
jgi:hypothetical protein